jgi:hypothetical protein
VQPWLTVEASCASAAATRCFAISGATARRPAGSGPCRARWRAARQAVVVGELVAGVHDDRLDRAAGERPLADVLHVLATLADVDRDRDHLGPGLLGQPADRDGGVEAS